MPKLPQESENVDDVASDEIQNPDLQDESGDHPDPSLPSSHDAEEETQEDVPAAALDVDSPELTEMIGRNIHRAVEWSNSEGRAILAWKKCQVMRSIGEIQQSGFNKHYRYGYATESDYYDAIRPAMADAGIAHSVSIIGRERQIHGETGSGNEKVCTVLQLEITLTCSLTGFQETADWTAEAYDQDDKGIPKALIQAEKYFLAKTFLASSAPADDPDGSGSDAGRSQDRSGGRRRAGKTSRENLKIALNKAGLDGELAEAVCRHILYLGSEVDLSGISSADTNKLAAMLNTAAEIAGDPTDAADFLDICVSNGHPIDSKRHIETSWKTVNKQGA